MSAKEDLRSHVVDMVNALIKKIDERGEDLTMTWKRLDEQPQPKAVPEKIQQALFELGWIRDELEQIRTSPDDGSGGKGE